MLKITLLPGSHHAEARTRLVLEGRLDGPWVGEVARVWDGILQAGGISVEVDLHGLVYASKSGAGLLRAMQVQGAALNAGSALSNSWVEDQIGDLTERFLR